MTAVFDGQPLAPEPPSTPPASATSSQPAGRRTGSRPHSLSFERHEMNDFRPPVVLDTTASPERITTDRSVNTGVASLKTAPVVASGVAPPVTAATARPPHHPLPLSSPCFVHSGLDRAASLPDWLRTGKHAPPADVHTAVAPKSHHPAINARRPDAQNDKLATLNGLAAEVASNQFTDDDEGDEDEGGGSLTKQLAETAVGVREMSKQLGRARVRSNIQHVLIITKARDNRLIKLTRELALYLMLKPRNGDRGLVVYVDSQLRHSKRFDAAGIQREYPELFRPFLPKRRASSNLSSTVNSNASISAMRSVVSSDSIGALGQAEDGQLRYWTSDMCTSSPHLFDFVVTLGGDGTVLFTSWLFQRIVPPVLPFALGSLGFLTNFDFSDHQAVMESALESGIRVNLRMRFTCTVYRAVAPEDKMSRKAVKKGDTGEILMKNVEKGGWEALEGGFSGLTHSPCRDKEIMCYTTRPVESFEVLNDLVVDRGPSPYVSLLELFGDEHHLTTVQADGLTISTPTGSTAYSLSAGGSLVHPEIPALLITPICPHTLSFRPMLLPDTMELRICVPYNSRSTAWASFDGRGRVELKQGDHIKVTASKYPFPTVCADKQSTDWFQAIARTLKWNERERQKSFVVVEEGAPVIGKRKKVEAPAEVGSLKSQVVPEEAEDDDDDDEDDEKFDIDDSSPEANSSSASASGPETPVSSQPSPRQVAAAMVKGIPHLDRHVYSNIGTDSPDRFHSAVPHPPKLPVRAAGPQSPPPPPVPPKEDGLRQLGEHGDRDNIHGPRAALLGGRSRIPRDRDLDSDSVRTPRPFERRAPSRDGPRRAFAVWGHDESDSNNSDSELDST